MRINPLVLFIPIPLLLGTLIGNIGRPDGWYKKLKKPYLNPPNYVFPIVWTILYLMIGISYFLALKKVNDIKYWILPILHLLLNFSYSPMFFYFNELLLSAILTTFILITAILVFIQFYKLNIYSSFLLFPYLFWLCFVNYISYKIYFLNK
jgi:tryptophan-rich sensory protein